MPPIPQQYLSILFLLFGGGFPLPVVFGSNSPLEITRPESYALTRTPRGTVTNTEGAAWIDDFGEGSAMLNLSGNTGWGQGFDLPGVIKLKAIETMMVEYWNRRQRLAKAGLNPNVVQLWMIDPLNGEAFSLYPMEFVLERTKQRPLLYFYRIRFVGVVDLLQTALEAASDWLSGSLPSSSSMDTLASLF